jgi:hypothetical protein
LRTTRTARDTISAVESRVRWTGWLGVDYTEAILENGVFGTRELALEDTERAAEHGIFRAFGKFIHNAAAFAIVDSTLAGGLDIQHAVAGGQDTLVTLWLHVVGAALSVKNIIRVTYGSVVRSEDALVALDLGAGGAFAVCIGCGLTDATGERRFRRTAGHLPTHVVRRKLIATLTTRRIFVDAEVALNIVTH